MREKSTIYDFKIPEGATVEKIEIDFANRVATATYSTPPETKSDDDTSSQALTWKGLLDVMSKIPPTPRTYGEYIAGAPCGETRKNMFEQPFTRIAEEWAQFLLGTMEKFSPSEDELIKTVCDDAVKRLREGGMYYAITRIPREPKVVAIGMRPICDEHIYFNASNGVTIMTSSWDRLVWNSIDKALLIPYSDNLTPNAPIPTGPRCGAPRSVAIHPSPKRPEYVVPNVTMTLADAELLLAAAFEFNNGGKVKPAIKVLDHRLGLSLSMDVYEPATHNFAPHKLCLIASAQTYEPFGLGFPGSPIPEYR